jgi:hypothetical protein
MSELAGRLQAALGDAYEVLHELPPGGMRRGRVRERLGDREGALAAFGFVAAMWHDADSTLQPLVAEARAALARLGAEPR